MQLYEFGCIVPEAYPNNGVNQEIKSKKRVGSPKKADSVMVPWKGFEPLTHGLENRCSIQLSYQGIFLTERQRYEIVERCTNLI